jgi:hypothetical protein
VVSEVVARIEAKQCAPALEASRIPPGFATKVGSGGEGRSAGREADRVVVRLGDDRSNGQDAERRDDGDEVGRLRLS